MSNPGHINLAATLRRHGIRPRHRLGQNFLQDPIALQRIVEAAGIRPNDIVLEVGCGLGNLTRYLAEVAGNVVAVELDPRLAAIAQESLSEFQNVRIVNADFLEIVPRDLDLQSGYVVAANIPYYVTSPILRHLLESDPRPGRIVLTVQKDVAERICGSPPRMSLLAVSVQVYGLAKVIENIPASSFYPVPKVDSSIIRVDCYDQPMIPAALQAVFFRVLRAGFSRPRKTLRNSLAAGLAIPTSTAQTLLLAAGIDPQRRAETLTVEDWITLSGIH
jgi:16S rRNA (adenine1518-N6/adenine1519-N6)-dimethyltransferase